MLLSGTRCSRTHVKAELKIEPAVAMTNIANTRPTKNRARAQRWLCRTATCDTTVVLAPRRDTKLDGSWRYRTFGAVIARAWRTFRSNPDVGTEIFLNAPHTHSPRHQSVGSSLLFYAGETEQEAGLETDRETSFGEDDSGKPARDDVIYRVHWHDNGGSPSTDANVPRPRRSWNCNSG
jgi:hypothetical protein